MEVIQNHIFGKGLTRNQWKKAMDLVNRSTEDMELDLDAARLMDKIECIIMIKTEDMDLTTARKIMASLKKFFRDSYGMEV